MLDNESMAALLEAFVAESDEGLGNAEEGLLALERQPDDAASLASVFRAIHTIKGNSGIFGFEAMTRVAHAMEDLLDRLRGGRAVVSNGVITTLLEATDVLRGLLFETDRGRPLTSGEEQLIAQLSRADAVQSTAPVVAASGGAQRVSRTLRIDLAKLDRLLDVSGEINIARGRLSEMLADPSTSHGAALDAQRDAEHLHLEMQELVMKLRMVPVGPTFRQFQRIVRDTAQSLGKEAELRIEGDDVEVDMAVVEHLRDPLIHMIRNSISHGIESAEARRVAKKPPAGTLVLRSFREAGSIVIEVADDGRGIDRECVLRRARERGIVMEGESLSEARVADLIFHPGFSTADEVTDLSGRGVGLDVVRRNVDAIHGSVSVESEAGRGTTFRVRLPLTLAIVDGLGVCVAGQELVIPMEAVVEVLSLPDGAAGRGSTGVLAHRGESVPFVRLREHLGLGGCEEIEEASTSRPLIRPSATFSPAGAGAKALAMNEIASALQPGAAAERENVVIVRYGRGHAALVVDGLQGECHSVVKPLPRPLRGIPGLSGSAILPSGRIAFIIDVPALLQVEIDRRGSFSTSTSASTSTSTSASTSNQEWSCSTN